MDKKFPRTLEGVYMHATWRLREEERKRALMKTKDAERIRAHQNQITAWTHIVKHMQARYGFSQATNVKDDQCHLEQSSKAESQRLEE